MRPAAVLAFTIGCSSSAISVPADRALLSWTGSSATDRNRAQLPNGFTAPDEHACAADTTRVYLAELFVNGIDNAQVNWHWAPIVGGPKAATPTLGQPEFSLAGTLAGADDSLDDVLADHPFGLDVDADVAPDPQYGFLPFQHLRSTLLHTEAETRIFPRAALGYTPQRGDRTLMRGVWVLDCGHPPYGAEMHPPTFLGYARAADALTSVAAVVVLPYRSSLLFSGDPTLATAFGNTARFNAGVPFPLAMVQAIENAVLLNQQSITTHAMMIANRFDPLDFLLCAPLPKPAGTSLFASYRFTSRSGVKLQATQLDGPGCVRFVATMDASYTPQPLTFHTADWPWQALSDSASSQLGRSIDVRQAIITALQNKGITNASQSPALQPDHPPRIDAYDALQTQPGADQDAPTLLQTAADDQPFPLYGRVRVAWQAP
jgi:hypothetical protein